MVDTLDSAPTTGAYNQKIYERIGYDLLSVITSSYSKKYIEVRYSKTLSKTLIVFCS